MTDAIEKAMPALRWVVNVSAFALCVGSALIALRMLVGDLHPERTPAAEACVMLLVGLGFLKLRDWLNGALNWLAKRNARRLEQ
jgi:hypothetical protein